MPSFSRGLEKALHQAMNLARERAHEFATLEHLLLALTDDRDTIAVLTGCDVDVEALKGDLEDFINEELDSLVVPNGQDARPDRRVPARHPARRHPRAVLRQGGGHRRQCAGRDLRRAREPCGLFPRAAGHEPARRGQFHLARHHQVRPERGAPGARRRDSRRRGHGEEGERASGNGQSSALADFCVNLNEKAKAGKIDPLIGRDAELRRTIQVLCRRSKNNPIYRRRRRRRQDRHCRGPGPQDRRRRRPRSAAERHHLRARHGLAAGRHALSRRFRGAAEGGDEGAREAPRRDPLHRRDPHRDRRGRHLGRRARCLQPAEAGAGVGQHALHRLDHLQGIPPVLREGPGAGAPLPEDRRGRADHSRCHRDREGPAAVFRGLPQAQVHR